MSLQFPSFNSNNSKLPSSIGQLFTRMTPKKNESVLTEKNLTEKEKGKFFSTTGASSYTDETDKGSDSSFSTDSQNFDLVWRIIDNTSKNGNDDKPPLNSRLQRLSRLLCCCPSLSIKPRPKIEPIDLTDVKNIIDSILEQIPRTRWGHHSCITITEEELVVLKSGLESDDENLQLKSAWLLSDHSLGWIELDTLREDIWPDISKIVLDKFGKKSSHHLNKILLNIIIQYLLFTKPTMKEFKTIKSKLMIMTNDLLKGIKPKEDMAPEEFWLLSRLRSFLDQFNLNRCSKHYNFKFDPTIAQALFNASWGAPNRDAILATTG